MTAPVSPIATQETLALIRKHLGEAFSRQWSDEVCDIVAEALSSAERRIEELVRERDGWKAEASTQQTANNLYREALDERNEFKNRMRAAEARLASLTGQVEDMRERAAKELRRLRDEHRSLGLREADGALQEAEAVIRSLPVLPTTGDGGRLSKAVDEVALSIATMVRRYLAPTGRETSGEPTTNPTSTPTSEPTS